MPNNIEHIKEQKIFAKDYKIEDKVEKEVRHDIKDFKEISKATMKRIHLVIMLKTILLIVSSNHELGIYIEKINEYLQADSTLKKYLEEFTKQYNFFGIYNTYNITGRILGFTDTYCSKREFQQLKDSKDWALTNSEHMKLLLTIMEVDENEFV
jgi:hypothetical protein